MRFPSFRPIEEKSTSSLHSDVESHDDFVLKEEGYNYLPSRRTYRHKRLLFLIALLFVLVWPFYQASSHESNIIQDDVPDWDPQTPPSTVHWKTLSSIVGTDEIPNIVHFVRQTNREADGSAVPFHVEFRHLLSYYSSFYYLHPKMIYFWTDTPKEMLEEARLDGDAATRAFFRIPGIKVMPVKFPTKTSKGVSITKYAHKSDFVRTRVMAKMGGIYFDDDAWVLRDLTPLRRSGFDNIFSLDAGQRIAQATWLCKPMNPLMISFARLQEIYFDGSWLRASNDLVTALMRHYSRLPGDHSSLVLEKDSFFPGKWAGDGVLQYYQVQPEDSTWTEPNIPSSDEEILTTFEYDKEWDWRIDWRRSWVVHGFSNALRGRNESAIFREFGGFTPEYILSKRSNIARALYPALNHMIENGFIDL